MSDCERLADLRRAQWEERNVKLTRWARGCDLCCTWGASALRAAPAEPPGLCRPLDTPGTSAAAAGTSCARGGGRRQERILQKPKEERKARQRLKYSSLGFPFDGNEISQIKNERPAGFTCRKLTPGNQSGALPRRPEKITEVYFSAVRVRSHASLTQWWPVVSATGPPCNFCIV